MKVDLGDFYMHFLIDKADRRYMWFMWEGKKYQYISMPFSLALALRLATTMMAPGIRHLRSCSLRIAIYIDDLVVLSRSRKESIPQTECWLALDTTSASAFIQTRHKWYPPDQPILSTHVNSMKMQFKARSGRPVGRSRWSSPKTSLAL